MSKPAWKRKLDKFAYLEIDDDEPSRSIVPHGDYIFGARELPDGAQEAIDRDLGMLLSEDYYSGGEDDFDLWLGGM